MVELLFPVGRMIGGNIDEVQQKKDNAGKPKIGKDGKPEMSCNIGIAITKGAETHWAQTPWGAQIYQAGQAAHPTMVANPAFAWKVIDGDSAIPNKNGNIPRDQVGYPGNWILWFSQSWLPKRVNSDGTVELPVGAIVPGYYVQVFGSVAGNKPPAGGTPGVYLNPLAVALVGIGERIVSTSVDTTAVGFGAAQLPPGAMPVPVAAPQFGGMPGMPPAPLAAPTLPPAPVYAAPAPVTPPVAPSPTFLTPGVPPAAPGYAPVPPAPAAPVAPPAGPVMLPAAQGITYEAFKAQNWTDDQLRQQGMMQ